MLVYGYLRKRLRYSETVREAIERKHSLFIEIHTFLSIKISSSKVILNIIALCQAADTVEAVETVETTYAADDVRKMPKYRIEIQYD